MDSHEEFLEKFLTPVECKVKDSSPIYHELLMFVKTKRARDNSPLTQAIVFCIAYTMYSRNKKTNINDISNNGSVDKRSVHAFITAAKNNFEENVDNAFQLFDEIQEEALIELTKNVVDDISNIIEPITETLEDVKADIKLVGNDIDNISRRIESNSLSLTSISDKTDQISNNIKNDKKSVLNIIIEFVRFIFWESFKHLALLSLAAFWAYWIIKALDAALPPVRHELNSILEEAGQKLWPKTHPPEQPASDATPRPSDSHSNH